MPINETNTLKVLKEALLYFYQKTGNQITFGSAPPANDGSTNGHVISIIHNLHKLGQ